MSQSRRHSLDSLLFRRVLDKPLKQDGVVDYVQNRVVQPFFLDSEAAVFKKALQPGYLVRKTNQNAQLTKGSKITIRISVGSIVRILLNHQLSGFGRKAFVKC